MTLKLFPRRKGPRTVKLEFHCTACGHSFSRNVRRLLVDLNTLKKAAQQGPQKRSEFIIPERIACPRCQAVDQFELATASQVQISAKILARVLLPPDPDDPVQAVGFTLWDGTPMHPLDALEMYADQVIRQPDRTDIRVRYANTLRTLGYLAEAEAQYHAALENDPAEIEALLNLAALHAMRREFEAARDNLHRLVQCAPRSRHPQRDEFAEGAQLVLDGKIKLEKLEVTNPGVLLSKLAGHPRPLAPLAVRPRPARRTKKRRRK